MWIPGDSLPLGALLGIIGTSGGTALLAQVGRDQGRKKQPSLWKSWGGPPTTRLLRFRDSPDKTILHHWRAKLERLTGYTLPSLQEEVEDLSAADQRYERAVSFLRESTRDSSKFPLVFAENVNYGFRRNLWGLKPYGLAIAFLAAIGCWGFVLASVGLSATASSLVNMLRNPDTVFMTRLIGSIITTVVTAAWLVVIRPRWVRTAAEAYAERLLGAIDTLDPAPIQENQ